MRNRVQIENIEEMRRREGIEDVELRRHIGLLRAGYFVKVTFLSNPPSFETLWVRITSIRGRVFRGKVASRPLSNALARLHVGSPIVFGAEHIHSIPKGEPR